MEIISKAGFVILVVMIATCAVFVFRLAHVIAFGPRYRIIENCVGRGDVPPVMQPFIKAVGSAKVSVRILAAELDLRLFHFPAVINAYTQAIKNGAKIEIVCGPLLLVDAGGEWKGKNPLWEKFKNEPNVHFYLRTRCRNINHGTIVDDGRYLIVEDYHAPAAKERRNYFYENQQRSAGAREWIARFEKVKTEAETVRLTEEEFKARSVEFDIQSEQPGEQETKLLSVYEKHGYSYAPPKGHSGFLDEEGTVLASA